MSLTPVRALVLAVSVAALAGCGTFGNRAEKAPPPAEGGTATAEAPAAEAKKPGLLARLAGNPGARSDDPNAGPCPVATVLYDAARVVEFKDNVEAFRNVGFTGEIRNVRGLCRYVGADPIRMTLEIDMAFGRGPAAAGDSREYTYWVAVTRRDITTLAKEEFRVPVTFKAGEDTTTRTERIQEIEIPRVNDTISGGNFEVLIGFEVSPQQVEFNRAGKRFRVNVGENAN
jgi:hypothetical protein